MDVGRRHSLALQRILNTVIAILMLASVCGISGVLVAWGQGSGNQSANITIFAQPRIVTSAGVEYYVGDGQGSLTVDFMGRIYEAEVQYGLLIEPLEVIAPDDTLAFKLSLDTRLLTAEGEVPDRIQIRKVAQPPAPPANYEIVSDVYEFIPPGITFEPPAVLILGFDAAALPENASYVCVAYSDDGKDFTPLEPPASAVAQSGEVIAKISHLYLFAVVARVEHVVAPANLEVSNLTIDPSEAKPNQPVAIGLTLTNSGGTTGSYELQLMIDGVVKAIREITLDPGASQIISFAVEEAKAGKHKVKVGGLEGEFSIVETPVPAPTEPTNNWWFLGGLLGALGLITLWLTRRRFGWRIRPQNTSPGSE